MLRICIIPGDGIGREVTAAAVEVLRATGLPLALHEGDAGWDCFGRTGTALPDETLTAAREADAVLFGAVASPSHPVPGYRSPIVALRRELGLYANIRPVSHLGFGIWDLGLGEVTVRNPRSESRKPVDLVVVRENTEGLYAGRERVEDGGDTAIAERVITRRASARVARAAFELARARAGARSWELGARVSPRHSETLASSPRSRAPRVTIVHKANVLRETCGLFRAAALRVAEEYPDIAHEELLVDNCALQLVLRPERFDVIVTTNLFGDILSDVACAWGGGLGLATSANLGDDHALFEPVHGAAPDIAGKGIANPLAAIGCAAMLLEHVGSRQQATGNGQRAAGNGQGAEDAREKGDGSRESAVHMWAGRIRAAAGRVRAEGPHTPDLGGAATTEQVTRAVIDALGSR